MALTFVKRSSLPVPVKGKVATCSVMIGGNGSITFSTLATKALGSDVKKAGVAFDAATRKVYVAAQGTKLVAKVSEADLFDIRTVKGGTAAISGGGSFLSNDAVFGDAKYDYKASGNQTFPVTVDEKNQCIVFELPKGGLTPRPVVPRKKKAKVAPATRAEAGSTEGTPVKDEEPELVLEPA